ncbi:Ger(x)C family spore germination protein [Lysinibacillus sphaericus]|uniref:Spore germination protein n=1 Tax=Lysinibacillus sphaericus OT4b.31 TaxID=1285586 RepID=R7Z8M7_LYSSH|nr:Ger(x)C family spore germination protein [Lysinibacillus sphaericus]EON70379.1 spore germination protein [Lysinibacillus sphaericus OT4b.31]
MKKKIILLASLTVILLLSGCWDVSEPQRMYYVHGVGIDIKDNQYEVYLQLINYADVAKSETANPGAPKAEVGHAKGKTMEEAIYKLYNSIDLEVFWGHMSYLILSEEALKSDHVISIFDSFIRFRETRYQIYVHCTQEPLEEILLVTPTLDKSITSSKLSNPLNTGSQEVSIEPVNFRNLILALNEPSHEVKLPLISINKNWRDSEEESLPETHLEGIGILSNDGFKGIMKGDATRGTQWMQKQTSRGDLTFILDSSKKDYLTVDLEKHKLEVKPIVKKNEVQFEINIHVDATINGFKGDITSDQIRKGISKKVKEEIKTTYEEGLKIDSDIYRLSEYVYRYNVKAWKKVEEGGKVPLTKDSISNINVHVNKINPGRKTFEETIKK